MFVVKYLIVLSLTHTLKMTFDMLPTPSFMFTFTITKNWPLEVVIIHRSSRINHHCILFHEIFSDVLSQLLSLTCRVK